MKTCRRDRFAVTLIAAILLALTGHGAWSQVARTIKIVVPYPPGSGPDILSRLMGEQIGRAQGPSVLVENRPGGGTVIGTEAVARAANISMTCVPYPGTAPAINALMGGHVTAVFADYPTVVSHLKSGSLRGLATASAARVEALPDVPTLAETGVVKYEAEIFYG